MKLRVSTITGTIPIILVAPHGPDDKNTDIIVENTAKLLGSYAVINKGFERSDVVDVSNDEADCNRIDHCMQDVVYDEFLKPIEKFAYKRMSSLHNNIVTIFYIHGCKDIVHQEAGEQVSVIVGHGLGIKQDSPTAELMIMNKFLHSYKKFSKGLFEGKAGGKYAGRDSNNMNQYFRKHQFNSSIQSMQLEYPLSERKNLLNVSITSTNLANVIDEYLNSPFKPFHNNPPTIGSI